MKILNEATGEIEDVDLQQFSIEVGLLAAALAKAQADMGKAVQTGQASIETRGGSNFGYSYATLADVWDACRDALTKNELAIIQMPGGDGKIVSVTTMLIHSSGQWARSTVYLKPSQDSPQGIGSAITYGRRYGLAAMVGIAPEDDDGQAATRPARKANPTQASRQAPPDSPTAAAHESHADSVNTNLEGFTKAVTELAQHKVSAGPIWSEEATDNQLRKLDEMLGGTPDLLVVIFGRTTLNKGEASALMESLGAVGKTHGAITALKEAAAATVGAPA